MTAPADFRTSIQEAADLYDRSCWRPFEARLFERMQAPDLKLLSEFARAFRINRSFKTKEPRYSEYEPVLRFLNDNRVSHDEQETRDQVIRLASAISDKTLLSSASKFVWARNPAVGIITDSRAKDALYRLSPRATRKELDDYGTFVEHWKGVCSVHQTELKAASERTGLPQQWGARRLFDYWLYENGLTPEDRRNRGS